jgi:tetratricopeptide (TPR) repeat protein
MGELDTATEAYRRALERDPASVDAANGLGVIFVQQGRAGEAVRYFEQAVRRDPTFAEAQLNLGIALHDSGQHERALAQYRLVERTSDSRRERDAARALRQQLERR